MLEGKTHFLEFFGNLQPVTKSGEQLAHKFYAFRENRLPFNVRVRDPNNEPVGEQNILLFLFSPDCLDLPVHSKAVLSLVLRSRSVFDRLRISLSPAQTPAPAPAPKKIGFQTYKIKLTTSHLPYYKKIHLFVSTVFVFQLAFNQ